MKPALLLAIFGGLAAAQTVPTLVVDPSAPRTPISPTLYGIFFEEINHAGEGGLYAEMVLNRDFEIATLPAGAQWAGNLLRTKDGWQERKWFGNQLHGWKRYAAAGAAGSIHLDGRSPLNDRNPHSLRLDAKRPGRGIGVVNSGFWGMNFVRGDLYDLTFHARTEETGFEVTAELVDASGRDVYARAVVRSVSGGWRQYRATLRPRSSDPDGRLRLTVRRAGTIWFDVVSLFPRKTFRNRPNGLRPDLVHMLAALKPAFVRFPGGAIVGGLNLDNRIQWKNSIGDISRRKGTMNLWGYYTTNGLGFHEYLQLCEDLGAAALWVCNPGFSDNYRRSEYASPDDVEEFVREALDGLEYALGPADSKWGAIRAANGHSQPFPLRYLEIGNEASGKVYQDNYARFYRAVRERFPQVTIISNTRNAGGAPVEMVDDHRYGTPESFFAAWGHYEKADRRGHPVYVGEYGVTRGVGEGNWMAALAEAVFLLGLERNADIVRMASYAPLFFNANDIAWPVNLIGFDSSRAVGRGSYEVQKLLAASRPDENLAASFENAGEKLFGIAGLDRSNGDWVVKLVSRDDAHRNVRIRLAGVPRGMHRASATVLGAGPEEENTLDEPDRIVPVSRTAAVEAPEFEWTLPPYSFTVLRIAGMPAFPREWSILAAGDSITAGGSTIRNYRAPLGKLLAGAGIRARFTGSQHTSGEPDELRHEGYGGKTVEFLAGRFERLYRASPADIVLLHAGHNHFAAEHPAPGILEATERIIGTVRSVNPRAAVLLAAVIPAGKLPKYEYIPELNRELARLAARLNTPAQPVILVDQAAGFDWHTDTVADLVHPNESGAEKMAAAWFRAISAVVRRDAPR